VSHELRQPLNTLQLALTLLGRDEAWADKAQRDRVIATSERNVQQMSETLRKLVELTRTGDGHDSALIQRIELAAVANDVIEQLREMAAARDVEVRIAGALPAITIDGARIELILVNLISNAIKYSDPAKSARMVDIASVADAARPEVCTLTIRDNGLGVAEREMKSIFARFYRGHAGRDRELGTSGLGLGLSIVADCVEAVNGTIRVESKPGQGTTFAVELPVAPV
jgi:signal transduction histidine kinase